MIKQSNWGHCPIQWDIFWHAINYNLLVNPFDLKINADSFNYGIRFFKWKLNQPESNCRTSPGCWHSFWKPILKPRMVACDYNSSRRQWRQWRQTVEAVEAGETGEAGGRRQFKTILCYIAWSLGSRRLLSNKQTNPILVFGQSMDWAWLSILLYHMGKVESLCMSLNIFCYFSII